jgi:hypothetical protein
MKKYIHVIILTFLILFIGPALKAQMTSLIFFSEKGEHFSVKLNGILQNEKPETNIKITSVPAFFYKVNILFENPKIPEINKTLSFQEGSETSFTIRNNQIENSPPDQDVIMFRTVPAGESIEINRQNTYTPHHQHYEMPGYTGEVGCPYPMSDSDFQDLKKTISSKSLEDSKLSIAKQVTSANCLFSSEVKEIMHLFSFEATRLEFAKFAYRYTFDVGNYYKVNEAFQFESSISELNKYIEEKKNR